MEHERLGAMTDVERLADFVAAVGYGDVPASTIMRLKLCMLDALGCAIGALDAGPVEAVRAHVASRWPSSKAPAGFETRSPDRS